MPFSYEIFIPGGDFDHDVHRAVGDAVPVTFFDWYAVEW